MLDKLKHTLKAVKVRDNNKNKPDETYLNSIKPTHCDGNIVNLTYHYSWKCFFHLDTKDTFIHTKT